MIVSFLDKNFVGLQNNASLVVDVNSLRLVKRPIELNDFNCVCEAFTENIQPTFLVLKDDEGHQVYSCLAGVPLLNNENKTEINGTDLKAMLSSDVLLNYSTYNNVEEVITYIINQWYLQVNQDTFDCELIFNDYTINGDTTLNIDNIPLDLLQPTQGKEIYNALDELSAYLKVYNLYIDTKLLVADKKVQFIIGRTIIEDDASYSSEVREFINSRKKVIKLWEYGIKNYGKWIADVNEVQGYYVPDEYTWTQGDKYILTADNKITTNESLRDIFPVKKRIVTSNKSVDDANYLAITEIINGVFNENINLQNIDISPSFETMFDVRIALGQPTYKMLPCGELTFNNGSFNYDWVNERMIAKPTNFQIGFRYTNIEFII